MVCVVENVLKQSRSLSSVETLWWQVLFLAGMGWLKARRQWGMDDGGLGLVGDCWCKQESHVAMLGTLHVVLLARLASQEWESMHAKGKRKVIMPNSMGRTTENIGDCFACLRRALSGMMGSCGGLIWFSTKLAVCLSDEDTVEGRVAAVSTELVTDWAEVVSEPCDGMVCWEKVSLREL